MSFSKKIVVCFFTALMISYAAFATEQEQGESVEKMCENEAQAAAIAEEEMHDYISQCIEEVTAQQEEEGGAHSGRVSHE